MKFDSKFSWNQLISNSSTGKSSASGFIGVIFGIISALAFLIGVIDKMFISHTADIITQSIVLATIGGGLLGYRKSQDDPTPTVDPVVDNTGGTAS